MRQGTLQWSAILVAGLSGMLAGTAALAADVSLAPGVEQRELRQVDPDRYRVTPPVKIDIPAAPPMRAVAETDLNVSRYTFSGNTLFSDDELAALLRGHTGKITFRKLVDAANAISAHYRAAGYVVARAYVPEQEITTGTVDIVVVEGALGELRFTGDQPITRERAARRMEKLAETGIINEPDLEYGALLLNDLPGTKASVSLVPGKAPGQSDVEVQMTDEGTWDFALDYNNYGSTVTGEHRVGAIIAANNLFDAGDRFMLRPIVSDTGDTLYGALGYDMPLFTPATTVGLAFSLLESRLGEEFDGLDIENTATSVDLHATHAFVRSRNRNINGAFSWESRNFERVCGFCSGQPIPVIEDADYTLDVIQLGATGDWRDERWDGGTTTWHAGLRNGLSAVTALESGATVSGADRVNGKFVTLRFGAQRLQRITEMDSLSVKLDGQFSGDDLDPSERISLGGPDAVRAYRPSEALGDGGLVMQAEWRRQMPNFLQWATWLTGAELYLLLDAGGSSRNDDGDNISRDLDQTRAAWGGGVRLSRASKFHFDLVIASRLGNDVSLVDQPDDRKTNFWAQAIYWF